MKTLSVINRYFLPGEPEGWRNLVGYIISPWGRKESDTTERLHFYFSLFHNTTGPGVS